MEFRQFGPYRIEELIGVGGMGEVYRAFDTEQRRTVALKVLTEQLAHDRNYRERFRREAHAAARLSEPHVVPIHRYGEIDGRLFLDMRLVHGTDLAGVLARKGPLAPAAAVSVISQVAHALDAAHAEGLVHRDVKPSNVLVCDLDVEAGEDEVHFVYLVDFGIARSVMEDADGPKLTQVGSAVGSFDYMAPERFLEHPADARSDVYSLACVLFEALTGRRPFEATQLAPLMWAHLNTPPPALSQLRRGLPAGLEDVVAKGLAKDPADRWRSAGALAAAARRTLSSAGMPVRQDAAPPPGHTPVTPQSVGMSDSGAPGQQPGAPVLTAPAAPPGIPAPRAGTPVAGRGSPPVPGQGLPPARGPVAPGLPPPPGAPRGTTPAPPRRSRLPIVLIVIAVLLAAALVIFLIVAGSGGSKAAPPRPEPTAGPKQADLLALLPADFARASCRPAPSPDDGDVAAVDCGPSATQPGPHTSRFFLYPDGDTTAKVFLADVQRLGLPELANGADCPVSQGYLDWTVNGVVKGKLACYVDQDNTATLIWTETEDSAEAVVRIRNGGNAGLAQLVDWWLQSDRSDFGAA